MPITAQRAGCEGSVLATHNAYGSAPTAKRRSVIAGGPKNAKRDTMRPDVTWSGGTGPWRRTAQVRDQATGSAAVRSDAANSGARIRERGRSVLDRGREGPAGRGRPVGVVACGGRSPL